MPAKSAKLPVDRYLLSCCEEGIYLMHSCCAFALSRRTNGEVGGNLQIKWSSFSGSTHVGTALERA